MGHHVLSLVPSFERCGNAGLLRSLDSILLIPDCMPRRVRCLRVCGPHPLQRSRSRLGFLRWRHSWSRHLVHALHGNAGMASAFRSVLFGQQNNPVGLGGDMCILAGPAPGSAESLAKITHCQSCRRLTGGSGICAMHYVGMSALHFTGHVMWDRLWLLYSFLIAVIASWAAMEMLDRSGTEMKNLNRRLIASVADKHRQRGCPRRCRRRLQPDRADQGEDDHPRSSVRIYPQPCLEARTRDGQIELRKASIPNA